MRETGASKRKNRARLARAARGMPSNMGARNCGRNEKHVSIVSVVRARKSRAAANINSAARGVAEIAE